MSDKLLLKGIFSKGYGVIPKLVMKDENLTIEAKSIYAYICSYAGSGNSAFPSVSLICHDLGISENRFYKHRKLLVDNGYITITKERTDTGWSNNIYIINSEVHLQNKGTHKEHPQNVGIQNVCTQNVGIQNKGTNNNSPNNNSNNNNSNKNKADSKLSNKQLEEDFENLWKKHPNKKGNKKSSFKKYVKAIEGGAKHEEISKGLDKFIAYCQQNKWYTPAYASTWFSQKRWEDDYEVNTQQELGHTADAPTESSQVKYDDDELEYANALIEQGTKQFKSLNAEEQKQLNAWRQRNAIPLLEMG